MTGRTLFGALVSAALPYLPEVFFIFGSGVNKTIPPAFAFTIKPSASQLYDTWNPERRQGQFKSEYGTSSNRPAVSGESTGAGFNINFVPEIAAALPRMPKTNVYSLNNGTLADALLMGVHGAGGIVHLGKLARQLSPEQGFIAMQGENPDRPFTAKRFRDIHEQNVSGTSMN